MLLPSAGRPPTGFVLDLTKAVAIDTETYLLEPGVFAPKTVCVSFHNDKNSSLVLADEGAAMVGKLLQAGYTTAWANPGFDIATLCRTEPRLFALFVQALRDGRVWCVQLAQKLDDIEQGCRKFSKYNLAILSERFFGFKMDKDTWRLRYSELDGVPVEQWPEGARSYAASDAEYTWKLYQRQKDRKLDEVQLADRVRFDVALYWQSREGVCVDGKQVHKLEADTLKDIAKLRPQLIEDGLLRDKNKHSGLVDLFTGEVGEPDWGDDTKAIQNRVFDTGKVNTTATGQISIDNDSLVETGDPTLLAFANYAKQTSIRDKDLKFLLQGVEDGRIHTWYDTLLDTGRTSSSRPNLQNLKRAPGVRECFVPREGHVFLDADYSSAELRTLAQTCLNLFGASQLADTMNAGRDPHVMMAGRLAGVADYDEMVEHPQLKHYRQASKAVNFGLPGGMGVTKLAAYAKAMGIDLVAAGFEPAALKAAWHEQWPEMKPLFKWVKDHLPFIRLQCGSGRLRKTEFFTEGCNYLFQGSAADAGGLAAWALFEECYVDTDSILYGCKPVLFVHDQFVLEAPKDRAEFALGRMCQVMKTEFDKVTPDVPVQVEGEVKQWWSK